MNSIGNRLNCYFRVRVGEEGLGREKRGGRFMPVPLLMLKHFMCFYIYFNCIL